MHGRIIHPGFLGLILALPPLIEAMSPGGGASWALAAGRVVLVELIVLGGLALAVRQRRVLRAGWHEGPEEAPAPAAEPVPAGRVPVAAAVVHVRRGAGAASLRVPTRTATVG